MTRRAPLRDDLRDAVLQRILTGDLAPGARVNESRLAGELGVSRTPLREALLRLEREGLVRSSLARGFTVTPLSAREARETYPMLWTLEGLAIRESAAMLSVILPQLEQVNAALARAGDADTARVLDARWHETLVSRCDNRRLHVAINDLRRILERYERLFMAQPELLRVSVQQHGAIHAALHDGDTARAVTLLEENWRFGLHELLLRLPD